MAHSRSVRLVRPLKGTALPSPRSWQRSVQRCLLPNPHDCRRTRQGTTDLPDAEALTAEALIKDARQRQHRRRLVLVIIAIVVIASVSAAVALVTNRLAAHNATATSNKPKVAGPPMGRVVSLKLAGLRRRAKWCAVCRRRTAS